MDNQARTILALDMSSTTIGVVAWSRSRGVTQHATWRLPGDIAARCGLAGALTAAQLVRTPPDLVVIESPVGRYAKALIPQARVSGAVLAVLAAAGVAWIEIAPAAAKRALAGRGTASKAAVFAAAARTFAPASEHEADAYALVAAALQLVVEVVP